VVKYSLLDSDDCDQQVTISKKTTLREFKELIQSKIGLPIDQFKVSRGYTTWKTELRNEDESMDDHKIFENSKVFIEKGQPMKEGQLKLEIVLFDPYLKRQSEKKEPVEEIFSTIADESNTVGEFKIQLSKKFKDDKLIDFDPKFMRVREVFQNDKPYKVFNNDVSVKNFGKSFYDKKLMVQWLDEPDISRKDTEVWIFVQQFFPSKFSVGERYEILIEKNSSIDDLKKLLSAKFAIKHLGITTKSVDWPGVPLLNVPDLYWDESKSSGMSRTYYSMSYVEGECIYFKDNKESLKELSPEEKKELEKEVNKAKRVTHTYRHKEEALTINAKA